MTSIRDTAPVCQVGAGMRLLRRGLAAAGLVTALNVIGAAHAQEMSGADRQAIIANFLEADTNNDGALYLSEFEKLMKLNADDKLGRAAMVVRTGAYGQAFNRLDTNRDGAVTREEIQALADGRG